jgi:hypothetical protein
MIDPEPVSLRARLRSDGRRLAALWRLRDRQADRLRPGDPEYVEATSLLGLGRKRARGPKKPA